MQPVSFVNRYFRFLVVPIISILLYISYWAINADEYTQLYYKIYGFKGIAIDLMTVLFFTLIISESIILIAKWIDKKLAWEQKPFLRIVVQFLIEIPIIYFILKFSEVCVFWTSPSSELDNRQSLVLGIIFSVIITLIITADYFFKRMQLSISEAEKLKNEFLQAQLNALKIQLDPHFLFNNFSTLQSLIEINPTLATEFLGKLSIVYRYLTQHREENLVTIRKEMDFVNAYLFLYKIRFGDNFRVEVSISTETEKRLIPPVSLQILIENAIKHNVVSAESPLQIQISSDDQFLSIINNLQPKKPDAASLKSGLSNIMARFELIGNKKPEVIKTETHFSVKIPLL